MERELLTIYPLEGFGRLKFGQSVAEAKKFSNIYGDIMGDGPMFDEESWLEWGEGLRKDPHFTEEEVVEMMQWAKESRIDRYMFSFRRHIVLIFDKDQLGEIRILKEELPAYLGEEDLFSLAGESAARYVAEHLQENPYLWEGGMFFVNHSIAMGNYFSEIENGQILWSGPSDRPYDRNIFLNPLVGEYGFDPKETPIYKVIE